MIGGLAIGAMAWGLGSTMLRGGGRPGPRVVRRRPASECTVSVLAFRADPRSVIDAHSGGLGYSHVALQGCEAGEAGSLILDCRPSRGVVRVDERDIDWSRVDSIPLPVTWAAECYGCARATVGQPYTLADDGAVCSGWIYGCMPVEAQRWIDRWHDLALPAGVVSPNQIVAALRGLT